MTKATTFILAFTVALFALVPTSIKAQGGNPLLNIPVSVPFMQNASISITDFNVVGNDISITSTLTGVINGQLVQIQAIGAPITITTTSCDMLGMIIGPQDVIVSNQIFQIGFVNVNMNPKLQNTNSLRNTLCSIDKLYKSNASAYTIVAKLKQLVRTFS